MVIIHKRLRGVTLAELLIGISLTTIVLLGVVSTEITLQKRAQSTTGNVVSTIESVIIMSDLQANALLAEGSNSLDQGLAILDANNFCLRIDQSTSTWICYSVQATKFYACTRNSAAGCAVGAPGNRYLGKISSIVPSVAMDNTVGVTKVFLNFVLNVPDGVVSGLNRTFRISVSPPKYRL